MPFSWTRVRRVLARRRRLVASVLAGLAVLCALSVLRPPVPPTVSVLAAARDLAPGSALALSDLRSVALPPAAVPAGALRPGAAVLGRLVAGPVRSGEPLTDVRLVGPALLDSLAPGSVAVPVRFADPGAVALLRPGDRIDVLATAEHPALSPPLPDAPPAAPQGAAGAEVVAADVVVVTIPGAAPDPAADPAVAPPAAALGGDGSLVVVACTPAVARALAAAAATGRLSPALRPGTSGRPP
ncbi:MAG TPA: Flp pilus assembly protein CpaB [Frankiaceae bacterium]|nr:Flp pilus assembly protein CpaB [Frankiaceae bacterium]